MKYSEAKKRIKMIRAYGYEKYTGEGSFTKKFTRKDGEKIFAIRHRLDYELFNCSMPQLEYAIKKSEEYCIESLRRAVITDGYEWA